MTTERLDVRGPLDLTAEQLDELAPPLDVIASAMGVAEIRTEGAFFGIPVDLPKTAAVSEWSYWSMVNGERGIGVGPADFVSVHVVLVENDADLQSVLDAVVSFDATYWRWLPVELTGADTARVSESIPYEGEPDDEPEFNSVLGQRDRLIVLVTAAGSDAEATRHAAAGIAEAIFDRVRQLSDQ